MDSKRRTIIALPVALTTTLSACAFYSTGQLEAASTAIYSRGARQHTVSVILPVGTGPTFSAMNHVVEEDPDIQLVGRNSGARMIEVAKNGIRYNLQATDLDNNRTLLFVWLDAGTTGAPPSDMALRAVERICSELNVSFEVVER